MFTAVQESPQEWYDTSQVPGAPTNISLPEPDEDYAYASARLLSWFPVINSKGATYFQEDFDYDLLQTLVGKQANLQHDKTRIIGTIFAFDVTPEGIDIGVRIDRECADLQGMSLDDLRSGNYFDSVSVELTRDPTHSWFMAVDDGFNVVNKIPVNTGRNQGIRRTTVADPYKLMGNRVVERIKPARFTGVGFVPNPADATAKLFSVAASDDSEDKPRTSPDGNSDGMQNIDVYAPDHVDMSRDALTPGGNYADPGWQTDGKKRYPLNTPEHVASAARFFGREENRTKYKGEHLAHVDAAIAAAKKRFGIGDDNEHKQSASADNPTKETQSVDITELQARNAVLEADVARLTQEKEQASTEAAGKAELATELAQTKETLAAKETELASVTAERDTLVAANADREKAARVDAIVAELEAIKPCKTDEERNALRETAAMYSDDAGRLHVVKVERENEALKEKLAAVETPVAGADEAAAAQAAVDAAAAQAALDAQVAVDAATAAAANGETASADFKANRPKVAIAPAFVAQVTKKTYTKEELTEVF